MDVAADAKRAVLQGLSRALRKRIYIYRSRSLTVDMLAESGSEIPEATTHTLRMHTSSPSVAAAETKLGNHRGDDMRAKNDNDLRVAASYRLHMHATSPNAVIVKRELGSDPADDFVRH